VPDEGESVPFDGWTLTVVEMEGRRVRRVRVQRTATHHDDVD
jgi:CBS domain containing-hemolysin-like protein